MNIKGRVNKKKIATPIIVIVTVFLGVMFYYNSIINNPLKTDGDNIEIEVSEGEAFNSILDDLDEEGYLRSKFVVKLKLKLSKQNTTLIPGTYSIDNNVSLDELIEKLQVEDLNKNQIKVTIPEGFSIELIAKRLEENGLFAKGEFTSAVKTYALPEFVKNNEKKIYNLEGFLYPDTYFFNKDATPKEVIEIMINKFQKTLKNIEDKTGKTISVSDIESIITKASLVEKETILDEERPIVASVIENRFKKNMKLEFCSTVNYVPGYEDKVVLLNEDIRVDSPYNTYKYSGLPVGPIASPGEESILAVLEPAETEYLYFVLLVGQEGKQHFSTTLEEHNKVKLEQEAKK
jgi:UPF0755 protein